MFVVFSNRHSASRRILFFGIIFFLCWTPATATAQATSDQPVDIGEIKVTAENPHESAEDPRSFTTVIHPHNFDKQDKSTPEMLSETVGVDVTNLGGEGSPSTASIRGSSDEQIAVFLDGVRMGATASGLVDFSTIPTGAIERIEVIRGAGSARFGTDAIGGVINIITKKADAKRVIDLKLTGASFSTLHTSESWREPRKDWSFILAHTHKSSAGDYPFKSAAISLGGQTITPSGTFIRIHNRSISEDVFAKFDFDLTDKIHFTFSNDFYFMDREVPGMEEETTLLYPANPLDANDTLFRFITAANLGIRNFLHPTLSFESGVTNFADHDHFTDPTPASGDPIDTTNISEAPEAFLKLSHSLNLDFANLNSIVRYQYRFDYLRNTSAVATNRAMGSHSRSTNSAFFEEDFSFLKSRLFFTPQLRVEKASGRNTRLGWRFSISGKPAGWIELKTNVQNAYRYPSFGELYFPDEGYLRGNENLKDEESLNWDAGITLSFDKYYLEVAYFQNRIDNEILFVPISAFTIQPINTLGAFVQGLEISGNAKPFDFLNLTANYTWLDAHFSGRGTALPGRPRHKFNARVEGKIKKKLTLFGDVQYVSSFPINVSNTVAISSHTNLNLGATLDFAKYFFTTFEVKDAANVQIYDARGFPLPRRSYWFTLGAKT